MESGFVHTAQTALADSSLAVTDLVKNEKGFMRIIKRHPAEGIQKSGHAFALDIEVGMEKTWNNSVLGIFCTDMTVIAFDPQFRTIYGYANVEPSVFTGCTGTARLIFNKPHKTGQLFQPRNNWPVMFEVIWNNNFVKDIESLSGKWDTNPILRSKVLTLEMGEEEGKSSGLYSEPSTPWYDFEYTNNSALFGINTTMKRIITLTGIGAAVYFAAPFFPVIRRSIKGFAGAAESVQKANED